MTDKLLEIKSNNNTSNVLVNSNGVYVVSKNYIIFGAHGNVIKDTSEDSMLGSFIDKKGVLK